MAWRIFLGFIFLSVLLYCVLQVAYATVPQTTNLPDLRASQPEAPAYWTKMPYGEEVRVFPKFPTLSFNLDSSGNMIYPYN